MAEGELLTRVTQLERACDAFTRAAAALEQQGKARQAKAARARCDASGAFATSLRCTLHSADARPRGGSDQPKQLQRACGSAPRSVGGSHLGCSAR